MVFSVGRIGFPTLIAFLSQLGNYELIFSSSLLFFGAIGVVFLQIIYAEAFLTYTRKARPSKGNFDNKIYLILIVNFTLCGWPILFLLEGALNQLWANITLVFHLYAATWLSSSGKTKLEKSFFITHSTNVFSYRLSTSTACFGSM